jgi:hypothetical protein
LAASFLMGDCPPNLVCTQKFYSIHKKIIKKLYNFDLQKCQIDVIMRATGKVGVNNLLRIVTAPCVSI